MRSYGAVKALVAALEKQTMMAKENTVCALVRLSKNKEEDKVMIGRVGAILHLLKLLEGGGLHGKKNSVTVRYALCSTTKENKVKAVSTGVMRALVELMVDLGLSMVYLVSVVVAVAEAKGIYDFQLQALVAEVRDLRDREHSATEQHHLLVQVFDSLQLGQVSSSRSVVLFVFSCWFSLPRLRVEAEAER